MKKFLLNVVLKGLLLGICIPATFYLQHQREHMEGGTYNIWEGFLVWTLVGTTVSVLAWQAEKYFTRKHQEGVPE